MTDTGTQQPVSVLGLGAMGSALAGAFLRSGLSTMVWNRTASRADDLVAAGAVRAGTPGEALRDGRLAVLCVVHNDAVRELLEPLGGELSGTSLVNLTNGTPRQARELAEWAAQRGARYLDGGIMAIPPMIGGPGSTVFYSGEREIFEGHRETFAALGAARYFGTDPGQASLHDMALLTGMYGLFAGFLQAGAMVRAEGRPVGELLGLLVPWLDSMLQTLGHSAAQIDSGDYGAGVVSPLAMQSAAFGNLLDAARDQGVRPDLLEPLGRLMAEAVAAGHGTHDVSAVVEVMRLRDS